MSVVKKMQWLIVFTLLFSVAGVAFADNSYDRELIVQDESRSVKVEQVFKNLMAAYEDEDAQGFLDLVSDDRFRQDYITFTDALYSDFRHYEIHHIDYWIDRVVPDHVKRFLYVRWEKRYENLDDGEQLTMRGYSRFLFDDVDGDYLLVELAGNSLFGDSLPEWVEEVPPISGQELVIDNSAPDFVMDEVKATPADLIVESAILNCNPSSDPYGSVSSYVSYNPVVVCRVRNIGGTASDSCQLQIDLYKDSYTASVSSLSPGETEEIAFTYVNSDSCPNGQSQDRATVDYLNSVVESNESNNERYITVQ